MSVTQTGISGEFSWTCDLIDDRWIIQIYHGSCMYVDSIFVQAFFFLFYTSSASVFEGVVFFQLLLCSLMLVCLATPMRSSEVQKPNFKNNIYDFIIFIFLGVCFDWLYRHKSQLPTRLLKTPMRSPPGIKKTLYLHTKFLHPTSKQVYFEYLPFIFRHICLRESLLKYHDRIFYEGPVTNEVVSFIKQPLTRSWQICS